MTIISDKLRGRKEQHKPKNEESKRSDKDILNAMLRVKDYLIERFKKDLNGYTIVHEKKISYKSIIDNIRLKGIRKEFEVLNEERTIIPDGGILYLSKKGSTIPILVSEVKKQGTQKEREKEGKQKQASGNAIERLGKNLTGIRAMFKHEPITPFVCFCYGDDFNEEYINSKLSIMNEFYRLNKIHVYKRDGDSSKNKFSPVSIYSREHAWSEDNMFEILKEVGEDSIRYFLH